jgi:hypothetical protein
MRHELRAEIQWIQSTATAKEPSPSGTNCTGTNYPVFYYQSISFITTPVLYLY